MTIIRPAITWFDSAITLRYEPMRRVTRMSRWTRGAESLTWTIYSQMFVARLAY